MDFSGGGTAIMLALAAVLWFLYLLPTWVRRREYLATERNATRLQRAIRVMAETSELPDEVRLEASAREAAQREKLLRQEQRRADAVARAEVTAAAARARAAEARAAEIERAARAVTATAERVVAQRPVAVRTASGSPVSLASRVSPVSRVSPAAERLRRARRVAGLLLLASVAVAAVQAWLMVSTGAVLGSWLVLAACGAGAVTSLSLQRRIVERSLTLAPAASGRVVRRSASTLIDAEPVVEPAREWTPVPIPKPLYLEHQQAPRVSVAPPVTAEELLRAAAVEAERALAAAHAEPEVVPFPVRPAVQPAPAAAPAPTSKPSRYASMGIVDSSSGAMPDLDEVLRRRRSG